MLWLLHVLFTSCVKVDDNDRYLNSTMINNLLILIQQELELRIETQKQTLQARDESIKKLLEMLQNKGMGT